jgi:hypothetical protein
MLRVTCERTSTADGVMHFHLEPSSALTSERNGDGPADNCVRRPCCVLSCGSWPEGLGSVSA